MNGDLTQSAVETAQYVAGKVDPYVPQVAKDVAHRALDYTQKTVNETVDYAQKTVQETVEYAKGSLDYAQRQAAAASTYASEKASELKEFGLVVVNDATTTLTAFTPGPVLSLITSTLDKAKALSQDPVGNLMPYVPTFVIHAQEKTYEVVSNVQDRGMEQVNATTGFIVTKVKGTVESVTKVPAVQNLIEQLNKLLAPVLAKILRKEDVEAKEQ